MNVYKNVCITVYKYTFIFAEQPSFYFLDTCQNVWCHESDVQINVKVWSSHVRNNSCTLLHFSLCCFGLFITQWFINAERSGHSVQHLIMVEVFRVWLPAFIKQSFLSILPTPWATTAVSVKRWNVGTNPDLVFVSFSQDTRLADRRVLGKFPRSQHRPFLITPPSKNFARACFPRPNNVSHVAVGRTMWHVGTKSARPSIAPSPEPSGYRLW